MTLGWYGLTSPFWGPRVLLEGDTAGVDAWFNETPYENTVGSKTFADETGRTKAWFTRFQFEYGNNFDDVNHATLRFQSDVFGRFGVDTETFFLNESVPGRTRDRMQTGDINLVYRFAHNECWQFRSGLGYNWLHDRVGTEHGVNFTYSADWYPREPFFASGSIDLGSLGDASRTHGRAIIGVTRNGWGVYTGYNGLRIGDAKIHSWVNGIEFRY